MKRNYPKLIRKAIDLGNKGKKIYKNKLEFFDHLDWEVVKDRGVWTDVFLRIGGSSVFAFTICSSFASQRFLPGSVPESFRNIDDGTWDLYVHSKYISHDDVGNACKKWVQLQGELPGVCLGGNVYFNEKFYGHAFECRQYPPERLSSSTHDIYKVESFIGPLRDVKGGVCG
jgi:hypothetical protein